MVASRDAENFPAMARGLGCRVSSNRQKVTVLVYAPQAESLMSAVRSSGVIAVVYSEPSTHTSMQLKGDKPVVSAARPADVALHNRYVETWAAETVPLGFPEQVVRC